ncbi:hypothetical protein SFRURICE_016606 [Spodoptera frugiperda]|nr:hypothetical protein SFRURICE_016606 [Spodoptera frugiperda]
MSSTCSSEVLLCTARVKVTNPATNETMIVRALLDSGSQLTIITEAVKRHLNLIPQPSDTTIVVSCLVLPQITGNVPKSKFDLKQLNIHGSQLADPTLNEPSPVNMLIGADLFWDIISAQQYSLGHGFPKLQASKFGWLVTDAALSAQTTVTLYEQKYVVGIFLDISVAIDNAWWYLI